ncbi:Hypothetical protein R9X50_00165600 [Acrodontium crateriforme]|uniref:AB hydrolase-1 domain-containing protein n=1 Tax=Acrodontium crateriforme TaxID=150365 RepID=A0AAQ3R604_9PEZI|nr:Hypothetical protein R9X50_00165600 [Acrodontium crateriforme]
MSIDAPSSPIGLGVRYSRDDMQYHHDRMADGTTDLAYNSPTSSSFSGHLPPSPQYLLGTDYLHHRPETPKTSVVAPASVNDRLNYNVRRKVTVENWAAQKTPAQESSVSTRARKSRRNLVRVDSLERLRRARGTQAGRPTGVGVPDVSHLSRAEQIIEKTPPIPWVEKDRLYSYEVSPIQESFGGSPSRALSQASISPLTEEAISASSPTPRNVSPFRLPIGDSVPMRTSSLWSPRRSSANHRKRESKGILPSRLKPHRSESNLNGADKCEQRPTTVADDKWADLGEDHETVRRIRELRAQRKSRLVENNSSNDWLLSTPSDIAKPSLAVPRITALSNKGLQFRQQATRSFTDPVNSAVTSSKFSTGPHEFSPSATPSALSSPSKGSTRNVSTTSVRLDQSHPDAADPPPPLETKPRQGIRNIERPLTAVQDSNTSKPFDMSAPTLQQRPTSSFSRRGTNFSLKLSPQDRWTSRSPDHRSEFEIAKNRRKSMSDVRRVPSVYNKGGGIHVSQRDSVESEVSEYLGDSRMSRIIRHPQTGRQICYSDVGDPNGAALFICVGMGLTRYVTAFYDEFATALGLRLITIDRPGIGGSEAFPSSDRSGPLSWSEDVLAVCQQNNIEKFSLLAHSAGAIYALGLALTLPNMIKGKIHLLAPWIPLSQLAAPSQTVPAQPVASLPRSQRFLRALPTAFLRAANAPFMTGTSGSIKPAMKRQMSNATRGKPRDQSPSERPITRTGEGVDREPATFMDYFPPDANPMMSFPMRAKKSKRESKIIPREETVVLSATAMPNDPEFEFASSALEAAEHATRERKAAFTSRLTQQTWALATRDSNPATDLIVCLERNRDVGFHYTDVPREVVITHGSDDKRVPVGNVRWLADQINLRALTGMASELLGQSTPPSRDGWADTSTAKAGCELRVLEGEGHGLMASVPVMSSVLTEIAEY